MRLKHLELQGYKTFASKTEFVFPTGVTAVVGPNGSGKSNVADSVRWVLGEQSYGLLRGKRTEDMIFAGSDQRPRAGMCEVFLTLDNSDGWLPVDFAEVVVGRRAYRSGENEYLLNGSRVRLKDVQEILGASGLARRTYTVIGQGLIDQALSLRPEERRTLFEEAAGISLYQSKRDETLRKLEDSQRNLERVRDILAEIGPRLRTLQRQAERSQQYERLVGELRDLQRTWYGFHWGRAQGALGTARQAAEVQATALVERQTELGSFNDRLDALRDEQSALRTRLVEWQRQSAALHAQAETVQRELAVMTERARLLGRQQVELEAETRSLQEQKAARAGQVTQAEAELARLAQQLAAHQAGIADAQEALAARQAQREALAKARRAAQDRAFQLASEASDRRNRRSQLAERRDELAREQAEHTREQAKLQGEMDTQRQTIAEIEADVAELVAQGNQLKAQADAKAGEIAACQKRQAELEEELVQARAAETELRARYDALGQLRTDMAGYDAGARAVMAARLPGVHGAMASLIQVGEEWEQAIEAALGADVQALVVDDWKVVLDIARRGLGRATLFPLATLREIQTQRLQANKRPWWARLLDRFAGNGVQTLPADRTAGSVVTCDEAVRPAVDALLGDVVLADDLQQAQQMLLQLPRGARVVTRAGEVVRHSGGVTVSAAAGAGGRTLGLLAQEREWRELPAQLAAAQQRAAQVEATRNREAARQVTLERERATVMTALDEVARRVRSRSQERDVLARAAERLDQQIKWQEALVRQTQSELDALHEKDAGLAAELGQLSAQLKAIEQEILSADEQLGGLPLEELAARLAQLQTAAAVAGQAVQGQQAIVRNEQSAAAQLEGQITARLARAAQLIQESAALETTLTSQRGREGEARKKIEEMDAQLQPAQAQLARLEAEQHMIETQERAARSRMHELESRHNAAVLEAGRREDEVSALRARIDEDLGLVELEMGEATGPVPLPLKPIVEELPAVTELPDGIEMDVQRRKAQLHRIGPISPEVQAEFKETQERHAFLTTQNADLEQAIAALNQVIAELDELMRKSFLETFEAIAAEFKLTFARIFGGGSAKLVLTDPDNLTTTGIDIIARPPGKRQQGLALLSGGERALTAAALLFAILKVRPTPFCFLDEVDAALDEANIGRFRDMLKELSSSTQFVMITHNRGTVEAADTIYGISMGSDSVSRALSLKLEGETVAAA